VKLRIERHAKLRLKPRRRTLNDFRKKIIDNKRRERRKYLCPVRLPEERDIEPAETNEKVSREKKHSRSSDKNLTNRFFKNRKNRYTFFLFQE
jgi:hypothetical protein